MILLLVAVALKSTAQELNCKFTVNYSQLQRIELTIVESNIRIFKAKNYRLIPGLPDGACRLYNQLTLPTSIRLIIFFHGQVHRTTNPFIHFILRLRPPTGINKLHQGVFKRSKNLCARTLYLRIIHRKFTIQFLDMDTMAPQGGTEVFRAAEDIVTAAQNLGETGWKAFDSSRNRYALVSDYLEDGMTPLRKLMYGYHRTGMDELSVNVTRARAVITSMLSGLKEAQQNKPMSALPGLFTEIKKDELINLYSRAAMKEKEEICELLSSINPSLTAEWEKIKQ